MIKIPENFRPTLNSRSIARDLLLGIIIMVLAIVVVILRPDIFVIILWVLAAFYVIYLMYMAFMPVRK